MSELPLDSLTSLTGYSLAAGSNNTWQVSLGIFGVTCSTSVHRKGNCPHVQWSDPHVPEAIRTWSLFDVSALIEPCDTHYAIGTSCGNQRRLVTVQQFLLVVHHRNHGRIRGYTTHQTRIPNFCSLNRFPGTCAQRHHYRSRGKCRNTGFEDRPLDTTQSLYVENLGATFADQLQ
jgi:hypothetical protein